MNWFLTIFIDLALHVNNGLKFFGKWSDPKAEANEPEQGTFSVMWWVNYVCVLMLLQINRVVENSRETLEVESVPKISCILRTTTHLLLTKKRNIIHGSLPLAYRAAHERLTSIFLHLKWQNLLKTDSYFYRKGVHTVVFRWVLVINFTMFCSPLFFHL